MFLLDEVDKMVKGWGGDPAAAMLEVLDPSRTIPSRTTTSICPTTCPDVFFIATANTLETIPGPLLDRMEVITLTGYTEDEKFHIAKDYLVPKQLEQHGLTGKLEIGDEVLHLSSRASTPARPACAIFSARSRRCAGCTSEAVLEGGRR